MYIPAHQLLLRPKLPILKVTDVVSNVSDLTTYTFTSVNIGDLGTRMSGGQTLGTDQIMRTQGNRTVFIIVHGEDDAITYTVSTCTIGGVSGTKLVDRGGGTVAVNTAIFTWAASALAGITNTNVVVTFSEAVTSCAIGVISAENVLYTRTSAIGTTSGVTAAAGSAHSASATVNATDTQFGWCMLIGSTCDTGTEQVQFSTRTNASVSGANHPLLLYEGGNAEIAYAAAVIINPGYNATSNVSAGYLCDWNGAGAFDSVGCSFI